MNHNYMFISELLSLCSGAQESQLLKPWGPRAHAMQQEKPLQWEAHVQLGSRPHSPQLEKSLWSNKDPEQPKINK